MSDVSSQNSLEVLNDRKCGIRVEFCWSGDRFAHTIYGVRGADSVPLLESIEGNADERFPSSPPYAELHRQGDTLFLTGATTSAHWSLGVEAAPDGQAGLIFDVACRLKTENGMLGCQYGAVGAGILKQVEQMAIAANRLGHASCSVVIGSPVLQPPPNCLVICNEERLLQVGPAQEVAADFPVTVQWKYGLFWNV